MWIPTEHEKYGVGKLNACIIMIVIIFIFSKKKNLRVGACLGVPGGDLRWAISCILHGGFPELEARSGALNRLRLPGFSLFI